MLAFLPTGNQFAWLFNEPRFRAIVEKMGYQPGAEGPPSGAVAAGSQRRREASLYLVGTMFACCSMIDKTISSPACKRGAAHPYETMLIPSVVHEFMMI